MISAGEGMEKREPCCTVGVNVNWYSHYGRQYFCCCSVIHSCLTFCNSMDGSTPGLPVHSQLTEFTQTCPLSWWCHSTILSSVVPFSCLQSFPARGSFPMNQFFTSGDQSIGASASVHSMNIQDWFPLRLTGLISLQSKGLSRVFSSTTVQKHQFFSPQLSLCPSLTPIHDYWKNRSIG